MKLKFLYNPVQTTGLVRYKLFIVMKLTAILMFIGIMHLSAAGYSQNVSISRHDANLETLFKDIKSQTGYTFFYTEKINTTQQSIDVKLKNVSLTEALDYCLKGLQLNYTIVNKTIVIRQIVNETPPVVLVNPVDKTLNVKGVVTDGQTKEPMTGVNIYLKANKQVLGVTNQKGEFSISVQPGNVVVFAFIGYKPREVTINDAKPLNIKMDLVVNTMNDVVITGYQTIKKDTYTGSAVTISGDDLKRTNPSDVIKAIAAYDPSFRIGDNNLTGSNPNSLPNVTVRGSTALPSVGGSIIDRNNLSSTYNQPAYMLDGFQATLEQIVDLDIDRIASVTILKDAAATAVYGSRAANGVIVITTKAPKPGKLQLTYNAQLNVSAPDLSSYHVLNATQKLQYEKLAGLYTTGTATGTSQDELDAQYSHLLKNIVSGVNTYWLSQPLRNAYGIKHSLDAQGGDSTFRYDVYGRYQTNPGVMMGSSRNDYGGGMTFYYNPSKKLLFRNDLQITQENSVNSPYGNFSTYVAMNPYYPLMDNNGNSLRELANWNVNTGATGSNQYTTENVLNPLYEAHVGNFDKSAYLELTDNLSIDYHITPALRLQGQISLTDHKATSDTFVSPTSDTFYYIPVTTLPVDDRGSYTYGNDDILQYDAKIQLNYYKQIGDHSLNLAMASEVVSNTENIKSFEAEGFSNSTFTNVGFARTYLPNSAPTGDVLTTRTISNFITGNYSYQNKYLLDATYNINGSSSFGTDKQFAPFWSTGIGWNMHKEDFMKNDFPFISRFKLTATTGLTGSVDFPPYLAKTIYTYQTSNWYSTGIGATVDGYGNTNLQWQRTTNYDLALELGLFGDRIIINPHYYYKLTKGLLTPINIAPSTGYTTYEDNLGDMRDKGEEVYLTLNAYKSSKLNINIVANFAHNSNAVIHISDALKAYNASVDAYQANAANGAQATPLLRYAEGQSIYTIYGVKSEGIDPETGKEIYVKKDGTLTFNYDIKDTQPIGDAEAKGEGNFGSNITYKQFYFGFTFHYQFGGDYYNQTLVDRVENADPRYNVDIRALEDRWQEPGDVTFYKNIADLGTTYATSRFVQKNNEVDLQSLTFSYDITKKFAKKIGVQGLRLSLTANDLFEASSIQIERGINYPYARNLTCTLQATF
jgi:TonB-linked SusC/RagA family outer membrane protein